MDIHVILYARIVPLGTLASPDHRLYTCRIGKVTLPCAPALT
jgi:hypothetical protein